MWRTWVLRGIGITFGVILVILTSAYPDATRIFISSTFKVTDTDVVSNIIIGFIIIGSIALILVAIDFILDKAGYRFLLLRKKQQVSDDEHATIESPKPDSKTEPMKPVIGTLEAYARADEQRFRPFPEFLSEAQKTIGMVGVTLNRAAKEQIDEIESAIKRGVKVTVLVLDHESPIAKRLAEEWESPRLPTEIEQTLLTLNSLRERLGNSKEQLELRTYDHIPNMALTILDQDENNAKLRMSNYVHGVDPNFKITVLARKDKNNREQSLIEKYLKEYQSFYAASKVLPYEKYSKLEKLRADSEPVFEARIVNKKPVYRSHDSVQFESHYRGKATNSFFDNFITPPQGQIFPDDGKPFRYWPDFRTYDIERDRGLMNGLVDETSGWNFIIEPGYPKGVYEVEMRLYHQSSLLDIRTRQHIPAITESFEVI